MNVNVVKIFGYWRPSLLCHYGMNEPSLILQIESLHKIQTHRYNTLMVTYKYDFYIYLILK